MEYCPDCNANLIADSDTRRVGVFECGRKYADWCDPKVSTRTIECYQREIDNLKFCIEEWSGCLTCVHGSEAGCSFGCEEYPHGNPDCEHYMNLQETRAEWFAQDCANGTELLRKTMRALELACNTEKQVFDGAPLMVAWGVEDYLSKAEEEIKEEDDQCQNEN